MGAGGLGGLLGLRLEETRMRSNSGQWCSLGRRGKGTRHSPEKMARTRTSPTATESLVACQWMELAGP